MRRIFIFFLLVLFSSFVSAAVGISPGMYNVDFTPNMKQAFSFEFLGDQDMELEIYASGELAPYVELSRTRIRGRGGVVATLELPSELGTPGAHTVYIGARQITNQEENGFGIVGNVKGTINVVVPFPGEYATIGVVATNANAGDPVNITVNTRNFGDQAVHARSIVQIMRDEKVIKEFDLGEFDLASPEEKIFKRYLDTKHYLAGTYQAIARLYYGSDLSAEGSSAFRLGELYVDIVNYTKLFERDKINRFEIQVESRWNDPIEGVYADVALQGYPMSFLTPAAHLNGFGTTTLTGFFDTTGIQNETFNALIKVHYADRTSEEMATLSFHKSKDYTLIGLIIAGVILIALIVYVSYVLRKAQKRKRR